MRTRYLVLGLGVVLVLALAVPALGISRNSGSSVSKGLASKLKRADQAVKEAQQAQSAASAAANAARSATVAVNSAKDAARKANRAADAALPAANATLQVERVEGPVVKKADPQKSFITFSFAECPPGEVPIGGEFSLGGTRPFGALLTDSRPFGHDESDVLELGLEAGKEGWLAIAVQRQLKPTFTDWTVQAIAFCARVPA